MRKNNLKKKIFFKKSTIFHKSEFPYNFFLPNTLLYAFKNMYRIFSKSKNVKLLNDITNFAEVKYQIIVSLFYLGSKQFQNFLSILKFVVTFEGRTAACISISGKFQYISVLYS